MNLLRQSVSYVLSDIGTRQLSIGVYRSPATFRIPVAVATRVLVPYRNYSADIEASKNSKGNTSDPPGNDPRTEEVSVETSMRYMKSQGYRDTYDGHRVWVLYRRNFKGQFQPKTTRESCFRAGKLNTRNPCPICRDEYLVLDYRNVDLIAQFISPFNGEVLGTDKTGLCRETHFELLAAIDRARDYGTISFDSRFREYDYAEFYPKDILEKMGAGAV